MVTNWRAPSRAYTYNGERDGRQSTPGDHWYVPKMAELQGPILPDCLFRTQCITNACSTR
jgi:hypothetical protein